MHTRQIINKWIAFSSVRFVCAFIVCYFFVILSLSLSLRLFRADDWRLTPLIYRSRQFQQKLKLKLMPQATTNKSPCTASCRVRCTTRPRLTFSFEFIKTIFDARNLCTWTMKECHCSAMCRISECNRFYFYLPFNWCVSFTVCELSDCIAATAFFVFASAKWKYEKEEMCEWSECKLNGVDLIA